MKNFVLTFVLLAILCGCSTGAARVHLEEREYETESEYVHIQIPSFSGFSNQTFEDEVNAAYETEIQDCLDRFILESQQGSATRTEKSRIEISQRVCCNQNPILSIVSDIYIYTDGLHGTNSRGVKNIDLANNCMLELADLFLDAGYHAKLTEQVEKILTEHPEEYQDLWEKPVLAKDQSFYIEDGDLVLYYPPYELSYYARGFVEFRIPIKDLDGYIKPCYSTIA